MADVDYLGFELFEIQIGDGATPEVFTPRCTLNSSRGFTLTGETVTRNIPDCEDDLKPSKSLVYVTAIGGEISGSGVMEKGEDKFFADWLNTGAAKNCKVRLGGSGGTQYAGAFKITNFSVTGERQDLVNAEITLVSHGGVNVTTIT